eukprot:472714_1
MSDALMFSLQEAFFHHNNIFLHEIYHNILAVVQSNDLEIVSTKLKPLFELSPASSLLWSAIASNNNNDNAATNPPPLRRSKRIQSQNKSPVRYPSDSNTRSRSNVPREANPTESVRRWNTLITTIDECETLHEQHSPEYINDVKELYRLGCKWYENECDVDADASNIILNAFQMKRVFKDLQQKIETDIIDNPSVHNNQNVNNNTSTRHIEAIPQYTNNAFGSYILDRNRASAAIVDFILLHSMGYKPGSFLRSQAIGMELLGDNDANSRGYTNRHKWRGFSYNFELISTAIKAKCPKILLHFPSWNNRDRNKIPSFGSRSNDCKLLVQWSIANDSEHHELDESKTAILNALRF